PELAKTILIMLIAVTAVTFGDIFMSQAMRTVGEVRITGWASLWDTGVRVFSTPKVWWAIACMATFFFLWQAVLSWSELSYVLPMTALTYVFNAFLAGPMLNEKVTPLRWVGTLLIFLGVFLVTLTHSGAPPPPLPGTELPPPKATGAGITVP
ncbi:MAG: DMT family transporter, partial [Candidatus Eremiobacterota bacterium]